MTVRRACVVGWPVRHSRSPMIHGYWLHQYGLEGSYDIQEVPPEDLGAFLRTLQARGYCGCNVTVPHKEEALRLADHVSETARAVGAANTLWLDGETLFADNTDVSGFLANLDDAHPEWDTDLAHVVVLGAGGAARGVVWGLLSRGAKRIHVVNRNLARADELARLDERVSAARWSELGELLPPAALLVNATSLGMSGQPKLEIDLTPLAKQALVADLVYVPLETELLIEARRRGNRVVDGLGMLLHQATPGFERWFGIRPVVTRELRDLIAADIEGR